MQKIWHSVQNFLKSLLIEIFHQNQKIVKARVVPNQRIVTHNRAYPPSLQNLAAVQNIIVHPNHSNLLIIRKFITRKTESKYVSIASRGKV